MIIKNVNKLIDKAKESILYNCVSCMKLAPFYIIKNPLFKLNILNIVRVY